ncbi:hypothetical protein [Vibrio parahaemolyticus]|uniref:hypothetical protein n=1 Tax=Vibrio parahaemolyticus TaxID=670 RepID=UPI000991B80C|nr:hypothetical protein [Vibrio parahaemolyticus]OOQ67443.1 hypothetical protein BSR61_24350 [Vibrio parahaemolyticus]
MKVKDQIEKMKRRDNRAYIRRVMWLDLDKRVEEVFERFKKENPDVGVLGSLYLSKLGDDEDYRSSQLTSDRFINATHVYFGARFLGVNKFNNDTKKFSIATESNAQLWYSQGPSGQVMVFIAPYASDLGEIEEKEIIIGYYSQPIDILAKNIERHFMVLSKYAVATSIHSSGSFSSYLYRKYLVMQDFRFKTEYRSKFISIIERILTPSLAVLAILVSLYTAGQI